MKFSPLPPYKRIKLGTVAHACNSSTSEAEGENPQVQDCCVVMLKHMVKLSAERQTDSWIHANDPITQELNT